MQNDTPLLNALGAPGRRSYVYPANDVPFQDINSLIPEAAVRRQAAALPELSELEVVRHFTNLSRRNHAVDVGFYPLGSCTMKYNPKVNEAAVALPGMARIHPYQSGATIQGALELMWNLQQFLCELSGLDYATLQPAAGAHGELTGMMIIKAFHVEHGEDAQRTEVIIPDSGHGTNPATAAMCGYKVVTVRSNERGGIDLAALRQVVGPQTAALMLTNPNTLGLFDENIAEIAAIIHGVGGKLYYDGANANAILGISRPGDMGFDAVHFNLHKTFSTPHGGGGPGAGPVVVSAELAPYLPAPVVVKDDTAYRLDYDRPESIGQVKAFFGNFAVLVRAYVYIRGLGAAGLREVSETAVLHANYLMRRLEGFYDLPYNRLCKHEFVLSGSRQKAQGVRTLDIAKRLLDYGMHSPTVYFPLIVEEAIMVEPTETESLADMDHFADIMEQIAKEAAENPDALHAAPHTTPVGRLDETRAARQPNLRWPAGGGCQ